MYTNIINLDKFKTLSGAAQRSIIAELQKHLKPVYRFAFNEYKYGNNNTPIATYYGVREDNTMFVSTDWKEFYNETKQYCDKSIKLACIGTYKPDENAEIYTHARFADNFIVDWENNKIIIVTEDEIDYYPPEGKDGEECYRAQFQ